MEKQSLSAKIVKKLLQVYNKNLKDLSNKKAIEKIENRIYKNKHYKPSFFIRHKLKKLQFMNIDVFQNKPKNFDKVLLYIHGGSFIANPNFFQWKMILKIAKKTDSLIFAPIYPKAPYNTYEITFDIVLNLYKHIISQYPDKKVFVIGDSAGGNISLVLGQLIKSNNLKPPKSLFALSPATDLTFNNAEIKDVESKDLTLCVKSLKYAVNLWAGKQNLDNDMLSPVYSKVEIDVPVYIFATDTEVLYPDIKKFVQISQDKNLPTYLIITYLFGSSP